MEYHLKLPADAENIKKLKIGDILYVTGNIFTARDETHHMMLEKKVSTLPFDPSKMALYHCGPLMKKTNGKWQVVSAGPTTSSRMEIFEDRFIEKFGIQVIIGKGGMGARTAKAMKELKAVYTAFVGGAAVVAAKGIKRVKEVHWLDLGTPECLWVLEVEKFGPLIVGIDTNGDSLFQNVADEAKANLGKIGEFLDITF